MHTFYEFFAGGGMARLGLGNRWKCLFSNDIDAKKAAAYRANFNGAPELKVADVASLKARDLPGRPDLVWASFPCQDLSLAGLGAGLDGERSGVFWPFWKLVQSLIRQGRQPTLIALENVCGALTSHGGEDFAAIGKALSDANYRFGAVVIDAVDFVPQSRPRLFIIGISADAQIPQELLSQSPILPLHPKSLLRAQKSLPLAARRNWVWWKLPAPQERTMRFEASLFREFDRKKALMNGSIPQLMGSALKPTPKAAQTIQVMDSEEIRVRRDPALRLPRQIEHIGRLVDHILNVKDSAQLRRSLAAHFGRLDSYRSAFLQQGTLVIRKPGEDDSSE
jgi:DNA-cytosine methyltransferase